PLGPRPALCRLPPRPAPSAAWHPRPSRRYGRTHPSCPRRLPSPRSATASADFASGAHLRRKSRNKTLATRDAGQSRAACLMREEVVMSSILQSTLHLYAGGRSLLTPSGGAVLSPTAIALMGATGLYGGQQPKDDTAASDANILNTALGGEFGALAAYQLAADSGLLQKPVL